MSFFFHPQIVTHQSIPFATSSYPFAYASNVVAPFIVEQPQPRPRQQRQRQCQRQQYQHDQFPWLAQQCTSRPSQHETEPEQQYQIERLSDGTVILRPSRNKSQQSDELRQQALEELARQDILRREHKRKEREAIALAQAQAIVEEQKLYHKLLHKQQERDYINNKLTQQKLAKDDSAVADAKHLEKAQAKELLQQLFGPFFDIHFEDDDDEEENKKDDEKNKLQVAPITSSDVKSLSLSSSPSTPAQCGVADTATAAATATSAAVATAAAVDDENDFYFNPLASFFGLPFSRRSCVPCKTATTTTKSTTKKQKQSEPQPQPQEQKQEEQHQQQEQNQLEQETTSFSPTQTLSVDTVTPTPAPQDKLSPQTTVGDLEDETPVSDQDDDTTQCYEPYDVNEPLIVDIQAQVVPPTPPEKQFKSTSTSTSAPSTPAFAQFQSISTAQTTQQTTAQTTQQTTVQTTQQTTAQTSDQEPTTESIQTPQQTTELESPQTPQLSTELSSSSPIVNNTNPVTVAQSSSQDLLSSLLAQNEKLFTKRSSLYNKIKSLQNQTTPLTTSEQTQLLSLEQNLKQVDALIAQSQSYTDQLLSDLE